MNIKVLMDVYAPLLALKYDLQKIADGVGPESCDLVYLALKGTIADVEQVLDAVSNGGHKKAAGERSG
jgi:hypothetical protein